MGLGDWLEEKANSVQSFASGVANSVSSTANAVAGKVEAGIGAAAGAVGSAAQTMAENVGARATALAGTVSGAASTAAGMVQQTTAAIAAQAEARVTALATRVQSTATSVAARVGQTAEAVAARVGQTATAVAGRVQSVEAGIAQTVGQIATTAAGNYRRNTGRIADTVTQGAGIWASVLTGGAHLADSGVQAVAGFVKENGGETAGAVADWVAAQSAEKAANVERNTAAVVHFVDSTGHAVANGFANAGDFVAKLTSDTANLVSARAQARAAQIAGMVSSGASGIAGLVKDGAGTIAGGVGTVATAAADFAKTRIEHAAGRISRGAGLVAGGVQTVAGGAAGLARDGAGGVAGLVGAEANTIAAFLQERAAHMAANIGAGASLIAGKVGQRAHDLAGGLERGMAFASEKTGIDFDALAARAQAGLESAAQGVRGAFESARTQAEQAAQAALQAAQSVAALVMAGPMGVAIAKVRSALQERATQAQAAVRAMVERGQQTLSGFALLKAQAIAQAMAAKQKAREIAGQALAAAKELPMLKAAQRGFDFAKGLAGGALGGIVGGAGSLWQGTKAFGGAALHEGANLVKKSVGFVKGIPGRLLPSTDEKGDDGRTYRDGDMTGPFVPESFGPAGLAWAHLSPDAALAKGAAVFVNGIKTSSKDHRLGAQRLANSLGVVMVGVWNATGMNHGGLGQFRDWAQSAGDKLFDLGHNPATKTLRGIIEAYGDAKKPNGGLRIVAHSQGSIIVSEALRQAKKGGADISGDDVTTLGNAAWSDPRGPKYRNYVFAGDLISNAVGSIGLGSGFMGRGAELFGARATSRDTRVMRHPSWDPIRQHDLNSTDGGLDYIGATAPTIHNEWAKDPRWKGKGGFSGLPVTGAPLPGTPAFSPYMALRGVPLLSSPLGDRTMGQRLRGLVPLSLSPGHGGARQGALDGGSKAPPGLAKQIDAKYQVQRRGDGGEPDVDPGTLRSSLLRSGGHGFSPDARLRESLGGHLGFDPGGARLHTGPASATAARSLSAEAFTIGNDVFFGANRYDPHSPAGMGLIGHELTHVGQQTGAVQFMRGAGGFDAMEQAARRVGAIVEQGHGVRDGVHFERTDLEIVGGYKRNESNRIDAIYGLSIAEATRRLEAQPVRGVRIDQLVVDLELDLDTMNDEECVEVWAAAIVAAVRTKGRAPAAPHAPAMQHAELGLDHGAVAIQRFESDEHRTIGNEATGDLKIDIELPDGRKLTYGEMVALAGDFFDSFQDMVDLSKTDAGKKELQYALWYAMHEGSEPAVDEAIKKRVVERYETLATKNTSHFSEGGSADGFYQNHHYNAMDLGFQSGIQGRADLWNQAVMREAFGNHYLTDMFSGGHVRTPRQESKAWYEKNVSDSANKFVDLMATFVVNDLEKAGEVEWYVPDAGIHWKIVSEIKKKAGQVLATSSLGDVIAKAMHDIDNEGLAVVSDQDSTGAAVPGGFHWNAKGDSHLKDSPETKAMAVAAVKTSFAEVEEARKAGAARSGEWGVSSDFVTRWKGGGYALDYKPYKALALVPHTDTAKSGPLPDWHWGSLDPRIVVKVNEFIRSKVVPGMRDKFKDLPETQSGYHVKRSLGRFADHVDSVGIGVFEEATGQQATPKATGTPAPVQRKAGTAAPSPASSAMSNRTGLPDRLRSGVESLSGMPMDDVNVHYNSSQPAQLDAFAYAQGSDIHLAPGQERQLPHEAWHVVQQRQGRVRPTLQMKGRGINDDGMLEKEADHMGSRASRGFAPYAQTGHHDAKADQEGWDDWADEEDEENEGDEEDGGALEREPVAQLTRRPGFKGRLGKSRTLLKKYVGNNTIDLAHRLSYHHIVRRVQRYSAKPKKLKRFVKSLTIPRRDFGTRLKTGSRKLYRHVRPFLDPSLHAQLVAVLNSSPINLRPGDSSTNRSIGANFDGVRRSDGTLTPQSQELEQYAEGTSSARTSGFVGSSHQTQVEDDLIDASNMVED